MAHNLSIGAGDRDRSTSGSRTPSRSRASRGRSSRRSRNGAATRISLRCCKPGQEQALRQLMLRSQLPDLLERYPADWDAPALVAALRPMTTRLYSVASSMKEVGEEVHLTVARLDSGGDGSKRPGAASHFLATRADGAAVPVFVEPNDASACRPTRPRDIIMIGPGTGVAPYRGFRAGARGAGRDAAATGCSSARATSRASSCTSSSGRTR